MDWNEAELEKLPSILRGKTESRLHEILAAEPGLESLLSAAPDLRAQLLRVASLSPFAARLMANRPELLAAILQHGNGQPDSAASRLHEYLARYPADPMQALRLWRQEMILGVIWRDLNGLSDLSRTLEELSNCADLALQAASRIATRELGEGYGLPADAEGRLQELVILAMGKLGGGELNLSSDIDLVFLYPAAGATDGPRQLDNQQYFQRLGQRIIYLLDEMTEQGRVYRVDMRLRPFGDAGPLVLSFNALELYLQESGRDWERYAYVKARAVTAAALSEDLFRNVLRPFVYRRYLDYGVFAALRDMREMIAREVKRRDLRENIKLGPGGIREIEFIAQCLQLIRGGSQPALRRRSLIDVLLVLEEHRFLPAEAAADLAEAYEFLRNRENRMQAAEDRQTHDLPSGSLARAMLVSAMNLSGWEQLVETLRRHTHKVSHWFDKLIPQPATDDDQEARQAFDGIWDGSGSEVDAKKLLQRMQCVEPAKVLGELRTFADGSLFRRLDPPGGDRLRQFLPAIVRLAAPRLDAPLVLQRLFTVLEAVGRRSAYFSMLSENPAALERLVELCGASGFLTRQVAGSPLLLDELLDPNLLNIVPDRQQFVAELDNRIQAAAADDPEQQFCSAPCTWSGMNCSSDSRVQWQPWTWWRPVSWSWAMANSADWNSPTAPTSIWFFCMTPTWPGRKTSSKTAWCFIAAWGAGWPITCPCKRRPGVCTRWTCGCGRAARRDCWSAVSRHSASTSNKKPGPGSTRRCCARDRWLAINAWLAASTSCVARC